jgi:hypothetical protein
MFSDNPNIEQLAPRLFRYKNFVSPEKIKEINEIMAKHEQTREEFMSDHTIDWYHGKTTPLLPELYEVWCKMNEVLMPEYVIHPQLAMLATKVGETMFIHSDSPGEDMEEDLVAEDRWNTCCVLHYGAIVYFGEFEGGEVFYPHYNKNGEFAESWPEDEVLRIQPVAGDLIIHGALDDSAHGVDTITSGIRYAFSNFVLPAKKNPGTFPEYGTKENEERWSKGIAEWMTPIDFKFKPSEQLQKEIDLGITEVRYR